MQVQIRVKSNILLLDIYKKVSKSISKMCQSLTILIDSVYTGRKMVSVSLVCFINSILSKSFHILSIIVFSCGSTNVRNVIQLAANPINVKGDQW